VSKSSAAQIIYAPRADATAGAELSALSAVYRFILFESNASKKAAGAGGPDDVRKDLDDAHTATQNCT
jgi:hypothetical protein